MRASSRGSGVAPTVSPPNSNGRGEVLLVSPSRIFGRSLGRMVESLGFSVRLSRGDDRPAVDGAAFCLVQGDPSLITIGDATSVPVIAFSDEAAMEQAALASGAWDFLRVPCREAELASLIEQWLAMQASGRPDPFATATATKGDRFRRITP